MDSKLNLKKTDGYGSPNGGFSVSRILLSAVGMNFIEGLYDFGGN